MDRGPVSSPSGSRGLRSPARPATGLSLAPIALALCAFLALTLTLYIDRMRWTNEEPRRALVAQEMLLTDQYLYSTIYQVPYFKKPPLHNWVIALVAGGDGVVRPAETRLVSLGAFLALGGALFALLRRELGRDAYTGLFVLLTSYLMAGEYAHLGEPDMLFALLTFLAYACYVRGPTRWSTVSLSALWMGLAILTKGLSPLFFYPGILLAILLRAEGRARRLGWLLVHAALALLPPLLWAAALHREGLLAQLFATTGREVSGKAVGSLGPWLLHLVSFPPRMLIVLLPWTAVLAAAFRRAPHRSELYWSSLYGALISLALFTLAAGARDRYLLPAVPYFAIVAAHHLDGARRVPRAARLVGLGLLGAASVGFGVFLLDKGIALQGALLCTTGLAGWIVALRPLRWMEAGLLAAILMLMVNTHGLYYYRTIYRPSSYPVAQRVREAMVEDLPVVVDPDVDLIHLAVDLEGMTQRPVYDRNVYRFPRYYLVTSAARGEPGGREILRVPYARRRVGDLVLQEIGGP